MKLKSPSPHTREGARHSVCIRFRKSCEAKYPHFSLRWVAWEDLTLIALPREAKEELEAPDQDSARWVMDPDGDECDECPMCELGDHHRCRTRNCPYAPDRFI